MNLAVRGGKLLQVQELLQHLPVDSPLDDDYKRTALHIAAAEGQKEITEYLLKTAKAEISAMDERRWTPLHEAANSGHLEICLFLLQNGADVTSVTYQKALPLHYFVVHDSSSQTEELLSSFSKNGTLVNDLNDGNESPLHYACSSVHDTLNTIKYLVSHGADINLLSKRGTSPLHRALMRHKKSTSIYLLENGAHVVDSKSKSKSTSCFDLAKGDAELIQILQKYKK